MALIRVPQQSAADVEAWEREAQADPLVARSSRHLRHVTQSVEALTKFLADGPAYVGVSWGKDSVVVAGMVAMLRLDVPLVWIRVEPIANPHCVLVRDAFLARFDVRYHEIEEHGSITREADLPTSFRTSSRGFDRAAEMFGERYVSGVRGSESSGRNMRMRRHGIATNRTCAPIGWWSAADVFAYLHTHDLPVHPAYAMGMGGLLSRDRIRVGSLGGKRGDGMGRAEWERRYYGQRLAEIRAANPR